MNFQAKDLLLSIYLIDVALRKSKYAKYLNLNDNIKSKLGLDCESQMSKSKIDESELMKMRTKAVRFAIKNKILAYERSKMGIHAYAGIENGELYRFNVQENYRGMSEVVSQPYEDEPVHTDYSTNSIDFNRAVSNLQLIPDVDLSINTGRGEHSPVAKRKAREALGVVNGFDFSCVHLDGYGSLNPVVSEHNKLFRENTSALAAQARRNRFLGSGK